ncbi:unnamed protein product [Blepharisma stoltei]|uniref:Uncharacterized protein n=1 Tax=Blepharisma stoltei TaxID=1481888 RepID=A0AAU9JBP7_9CILI|nr:unnamed protein product [Blepharisma stoltei]
MLRSLRQSIALANKASLLATQPSRGLFGLGSIYASLKGQFKHAIEPGPGRHNTHTMEATETELFDEDAHEVQAMVTNNPFDLEIMMGDTNPLRNFGTLDNPVLLFSANVGWRYVMCAGANDEEEGLQHQGIWFILREGPIHRCHSCGQCFKLINLKDEISAENDYYLEHYMPVLEEEMGDDDDLVTRWSFHKFAEPYAVLHPHQNTNYAYILVNPDDHDRILTDPAYRMQKLHEGHEKLTDLHKALIDVENRILWENGGYYPKYNYSVQDYEDLITSELAIRKLDRIFQKVSQFEKRSILEPIDHERREKRMLERAAERTGKNYVFYLHTNELEQRFNDYYQTDLDPEEELQNTQDDYEDLVASGIFNFKNYEFVEEDLMNPVPVVMGTYEKKMFRFKHRKWNDDPATHFIRENRMIRRYLDRLQKRDPKELSFKDAEEQAHNMTKESAIRSRDLKKAVYSKVDDIQNFIMDEAVQQYKDYYESDVEDLKDFDYMTAEDKVQFAGVFKDYSKPLGTQKLVLKVPKEIPGTSWRERLKKQIAIAKTQIASYNAATHKINTNFKYASGSKTVKSISQETLKELFASINKIEPAGETGNFEDSRKFH